MSMAEKTTNKKSGDTTANSTRAWLRCDRHHFAGRCPASEDVFRRWSYLTFLILSLTKSMWSGYWPLGHRTFTRSDQLLARRSV
jgi:hypothetical protein